MLLLFIYYHMRIFWYLSFVLSILIFVAPISYGGQIKQSSIPINKYSTKIENTEYEYVSDEIFSSDGKHFAYLTSRSGPSENDYHRLMVIDGIVYSNIRDLPIFSPDGKHFAFITENPDWSMYVVEDGIKIGKNYRTIRSLIFSPDSKSLAYIAESSWWYVIVRNWIEGKTYSNIIEDPKFSPDSKSLAYLGVNHSGEDYNTVIVKNWVELWKEYSWVSNPIFSPDSHHFAFIATKYNGTSIIIRDGVKMGKDYRLIYSESFVFSPDSKNLFYSVEDDTRWSAIYRDGVELYAGEGSLGKPVFSPNGKHFMYIISTGSEDILLKDGVKIGVEYIGKDNPIFSPDSQHFAYIATRGDSKYGTGWKNIIIKDGINIKEYDGYASIDPIFSPDSKNLLFVVLNGKRKIMKDGLEIRKKYSSTYAPSFSTDGKHFAYIAEDSDWNRFVVRDGVEIWKEYKLPLDVIFSPNLNKIVFKWVKNGKIFFITVTFP